MTSTTKPTATTPPLRSSRLARFAAITALAFVLSRVLGLVREQVITARFGLGSSLDAYRIAFQIPDLLFILISGGALGTAFIPVFAELRGVDERAAWRMASGVLGIVAVVMTGLIVLAWVLAPWLISDVMARGDAPEDQQLATNLMRILLLSPLFLVLASVAAAVLQSFEAFTLPAFAPILYNTCIILGALFLAPSIGIYGLTIGVVVGAFIFFLMQFPAAVRRGLRPPRSSPFGDPNVRRTFRLLLPRIVGQAALAANTVIAISLASGIDRGASAFYSGWILFALPVGLFGTSVATVAFPALSREAGEKDYQMFLYLLRRAVRGVLFFVLPASIGLIALREPIISLIYERGEFDHSDTLLTAVPLLYFSIGMWAYALADVLPRAFYAMQDSRTPVKIALVAVVIDATLSFLLVGPFGLGGLAFAFSVATMVHATLLLWALRRRVGSVLNRPTMLFTARAALATFLMFAALWLARPLLSGYQDLPLLSLALRVGVVVAGGGAVYVLASLLLRQEEVGTLLRLARR